MMSNEKLHNNQIGLRIRTARKEKGINQTELANLLGKSLRTIQKYESGEIEVSIAMLNELVDKILVHERDRKGSKQTTQEIEVFFNFVGRFVPPSFGEELTPEEMEAVRKREARKDRLHQNYLKRKASGKQKEYEERVRAKKKAELDAKKDALRAADIANGVFVPVSNLPLLEPRKNTDRPIHTSTQYA